MKEFNQLAKENRLQIHLSSVKTKVAINFLNPFMPTGRFQRQLCPIHPRRQHVPNVTLLPSPRADKMFRTSIPRCQIRKARRERVFYYYAGSV